MEGFMHKLFYERCYLCNEYSDPICPICIAKLEPLKINFESRIICFYKYNDVAKEILKLSKYSPHCFYLLKLLSKSVFLQNADNLRKVFNDRNSLVSFIPLSKIKFFERGFNQAEIIADILADILHIPKFELIKRSKDTKPLFELSRKEREFELKNAFKVHFLARLLFLKNNKLILVDDLYTTGSTFKEVTKVLKKAGYTDIYYLSLFSKK